MGAGEAAYCAPMARLPRAVLPGHPHLLVQRGHSGQAVFIDPADRERYLAALRDAAAEAQVAVHAYGLLEHEVRLLATPATVEGLGHLLQATGRRYVRQFNRLHQRSGSPWEGRFRSAIVEAHTHFIACLRFVESVEGEGELPPAAWSSARHHLGSVPSALVREHPAYWALGNTPFEREAHYRRLIERALPEQQLAAILHALQSGWALGSEAFAAATQGETGRRVLPRRPGRPRKASD